MNKKKPGRIPGFIVRLAIGKDLYEVISMNCKVTNEKAKKMQEKSLIEKYPPSKPCSCVVCVAYCKRPGWWTLDEARLALESGYANRMMLEISPEKDFGVLSPAFKGNEENYALQIFADKGCTFLKDGLCKLFETGFQPLECRYCHHARKGKGTQCHSDIERSWNTPEGKRLVVRWGNLTGFWQRQGLIVKEKPE